MRKVRSSTRYPVSMPSGSVTTPSTRATYTRSGMRASNCAWSARFTPTDFAKTRRPEVSRSSRWTTRIRRPPRARIQSPSRRYTVRSRSVSVAIVRSPGGLSTTKRCSSSWTSRSGAGKAAGAGESSSTRSSGPTEASPRQTTTPLTRTQTTLPRARGRRATGRRALRRELARRSGRRSGRSRRRRRGQRRVRDPHPLIRHLDSVSTELVAPVGVLNHGRVRRGLSHYRRRQVDLLMVHRALDVHRRRIDWGRDVDGPGIGEWPEELIEHREGGEPEGDIGGSSATGMGGRHRHAGDQKQREHERDEPSHDLTFTLAPSPVKRPSFKC